MVTTRGDRRRYEESPEGQAEAAAAAAAALAEDDRRSAAAAHAALVRDSIRTGDLRALEGYLAAGTDPNLPGACECGFSLPGTVRKGYLFPGCFCMPTLRYGFKRPARGDRPPLMVAAEYDAAPAVAALVAAGADVDHKFEGTTAVKVAASRGHAAALEALLAHGADPTFKPIAGRTALWDAAAGGHARCIDLLLDAGARDLNTRSLFSYTALWIALLHGHLEATRTLLRRGATIHRHLAGHLGPAPRWETPMTLVADRIRKEAERREQYGRYFKWGESPETLEAMRACADLVSDALAAAGGSWSATRRIVTYWPLGPNKHFPSEDFVSYWSGPDGSSTIWPSYVRAARARLVALRALCAAGRARPLASAPSELAWIFAAHDDGAADEPAAKKPSRGAQLPDPLFRRVVLYWL